jgi:hypothetical protein
VLPARELELGAQVRLHEGGQDGEAVPVALAGADLIRPRSVRSSLPGLGSMGSRPISEKEAPPELRLPVEQLDLELVGTWLLAIALGGIWIG